MTKVIKRVLRYSQTIASEDYSWSDKFQLVLQVARKVQVISVHKSKGIGSRAVLNVFVL